MLCPICTYWAREFGDTIAEHHPYCPAVTGEAMFQKPTDTQLENKFAHHAPKGDQAERYAENRKKFLVLAKHVRDVTPCSPEQTLAIGRLYEAMMLANAAIAINE